MASPANITLTDGANNHLFTPVAVGSGQAVLVCREGTTSAGNSKIILNLNTAHPGRATNKVEIRLERPIEVTSDGVTSVRSTPRFVGSYVIPDDMTQAEREAFTAWVVDLIAEAVVQAYTKTLDPMV